MRRSLRNTPRVVQAVQLCPSDGSTATLLRRVERVSGRPIKIIDKRLPCGGPSGVWVSLPDKDLVVLDTEGTPIRREAALCHEIGHIVLGHSPSEADIAATFPDLAPALVTALLSSVSSERGGVKPMMFRCDYEDEQERAAEEFATELLGALLDSRNRVISHAHNRFR